MPGHRSPLAELAAFWPRAVSQRTGCSDRENSSQSCESTARTQTRARARRHVDDGSSSIGHRKRIFPVLIHASSAASRVDWRAEYAALQYEMTELPAEVENGIRRYLTSFGLSYAAFDFAIDSSEKWVFLEANTAGQYGFLETNTGAPISDSLADLLAEGIPCDRLD